MNIELPEEIISARMTLRATRPGYESEIQAAVEESLAELRPWMPWARDERRYREYDRYCREMAAKWLLRQELDFCFFRNSDQLLVGKGGIHSIDMDIPKVEIGYWVRSSCARSGFATEATKAMAQFARSQLKAVRIEIACAAANRGSRRVAEKAGFKLEAIKRHSRRDAEGALADSCLFAMTFDD